MKIPRLGLLILASMIQACAAPDDDHTLLPWAKPAPWEANGMFSVSSTKEHGEINP
ncbi:MAG: hypothetical protein LBI37_01610 [Puniceicoccales bacterium]|jgi:hypothetical protein|nr:hypothetical protein [Puniceicoccales bacterium]